MPDSLDERDSGIVIAPEGTRLLRLNASARLALVRDDCESDVQPILHLQRPQTHAERLDAKLRLQDVELSRADNRDDSTDSESGISISRRTPLMLIPATTFGAPNVPCTLVA